MASFNSKEYAWIDVNVVLLGKPVAGLRAIEYKSKRAKEALYATGKRHVAYRWARKNTRERLLFYSLNWLLCMRPQKRKATMM